MGGPSGLYSARCRQSEGEDAVLTNAPDSIIFRTSWLYSSHGRNFVKTMLRLGREQNEIKVVFDQTGTPTNAADLAAALRRIEKGTYGECAECAEFIAVARLEADPVALLCIDCAELRD